ncbi:MAG: ROK family transcriptional regulator [Anaerolineae bacterium]
MTSGKATHEQLKRHNWQLLLRAVYSGGVNNRAALAQATGLAKPTVSDLISELMSEGFLEEGGIGESTESGGKRPRLLEFRPQARQIIGVSLDSHFIAAVLSNLSGQVIAQHIADVGKHDVLTLLGNVINGLVAQLDAPLLCISVGVPGLVDKAQGIVEVSNVLGWRNVHLAATLNEQYDVPIYVGNNTELAALSQIAFASDAPSQQNTPRSLVTVLLNDSVEVGIALDEVAYHGGSDIGCLRIAGVERLDSLLGWQAVQNRARELIQPGSYLAQFPLSYLYVRHAADHNDAAALQLYQELADHLAHVFAWIIGLLRPNHVSLVGPIADMGDRLMRQVAAKVEYLLLPELVRHVHFSMADDAQRLSAHGAVAQALRNELGIL